MLSLSAIYIYPIKGLAGISLPSSQVEERGLQYDRRWMLVDDTHTFLTQRKYPQMALLTVQLTSKGLRVQAPGKADLLIPLGATGEKLRVTVWDDTCEAETVNTVADNWFSEALGVFCRLVYMPDHSIRPVDSRYAVADNYVSFADAYPFLVISEESLADLNGRLAEPVPMNRFRPTLVVKGATPFAEDTWYRFRIGECIFYGVKPCARCVVTTIDQETAEKGKEPLKTLSIYRQRGHKILFGQNVIFGREGSKIQVGDEVEVLQLTGTVINALL